MRIQEFVTGIKNRKTKTIEPMPIMSDIQKEIDGKFKITKTLMGVQRRMNNIFKNFYNENKDLKEGRNDIKSIILSAALEVPEEFSLLKIDDKIREKLIRSLIGRKKFIKQKNVTGKYIGFLNSNIDKIFKADVLRELIIGDLRTSFINVYNAIKNGSENFLLNASEKEIRAEKTGMHKKIAEVFSIEMIAPNTSTHSKLPNDTYFEAHPNTERHFPDYVFHFGDNPNKDAKNIRKTFGISDDVKKVYVESKAFSRIVGRQTSPEKFKDVYLQDNVLFGKLSSIKLGGESVKFNGIEMKKLLVASGIDLKIPIIYLNILGKRKASIVKAFKNTVKNSDKFTGIKKSKGQISFLKNGKKFYGFEIGSEAYNKKKGPLEDV